MKHINWKERCEDYALEVVPDSYRNWSWVSLVGVVLAASTAMFFLAFGADLVHMFGTRTLIIGMLITTVCFGIIGFIFAVTASEVGLNIDLITSGSGMGYRGAGLTSLIYALAFVLYFSIEGSIIAQAVHIYFTHLPVWLIYIVVGLTFIPLTWYGLTAMNYVMWITWPAYIVLLIWCVCLVIHGHSNAPVNFLSYRPDHLANPLAGPALLQLLAAVPALIANATIAADVGRFLPKKRRTIGAIGLSFFANGLAFLGASLLGAWLSLKLHQTNPGVYFPMLIGIWGTVFVVITQIRINVLNTYSGSLAFSTFFSRTFNVSPGRHWWILLSVTLSIILMFGDILSHLTSILTFESVFMIAWVMAVFSYILFNRYLFKLSPKRFPFLKGDIPNWNPIGLTALIIALLVSVPMAFGLCGPLGKTVAPFVSGGLAFMIVPLVTFVVFKRYKKIR